MSTRGWLVLALACASVSAGCARGNGRGARDTGVVSVPRAGDAGTLSSRDGSHAGDASHSPDAFVAPWGDAGSVHHDAAPTYVDASVPRPDASAAVDAATVDAAWPMLDIGTSDAQTVAGATRCWESQPVLASGVFVGTTCGAIDLVGASCGRPGAPERYFTAFGPSAGGQTSYFVQIDPPEFVIQELSPTEVGFDCAIIDGACSAGRRMLVTDDIAEFSVERGTGGCGEFTMTVGAM